MDELLSTNWGDIVGAVGLVITIVGFGVAIYQATRARRAAAAAEAASRETSQAIARVLTVVDLERAVALIQRLKVLHRDGKWEASLDHYQTLRAMLTDIDARHPNPTQELRATLGEARSRITAMDVGVDRALRANRDPDRAREFNLVLNTIQEDLEKIASSAFPESETGR
jgi:hypothetical protein